MNAGYNSDSLDIQHPLGLYIKTNHFIFKARNNTESVVMGKVKILLPLRVGLPYLTIVACDRYLMVDRWNNGLPPVLYFRLKLGAL